MLFHDAMVSININNQTTMLFKPHRRVCQGCLLAPYLFIITAKALNTIVEHTMVASNVKGITLPQDNSQQIISQYADDTSFTVKVEETSVDHIVGIFHKFGNASAFEVNWHKNVAYWCSRGRPPRWVEKYQWKWATIGDLSKLLGMPFGLKLEL
jgi:hypothetical protein